MPVGSFVDFDSTGIVNFRGPFRKIRITDSNVISYYDSTVNHTSHSTKLLVQLVDSSSRHELNADNQLQLQNSNVNLYSSPQDDCRKFPVFNSTLHLTAFSIMNDISYLDASIMNCTVGTNLSCASVPEGDRVSLIQNEATSSSLFHSTINLKNNTVTSPFASPT